MESRRMTTRSSRRASARPVSPSKQAVMEDVMQGAGKATSAVKRSSRKVLADKTNATFVAKLVPGKSPKKDPTAAGAPSPIKAEEEVASPCLALQSFEQQPATPVTVRGEDLLRSLVHSNLTIIESPQAVTPQFGVPDALPPAQDTLKEAEEVAAKVEVPTQLQQGEVVAAKPSVEASPAKEATATVSERLSSAWVGHEAETPQFGVPTDLSPAQDTSKEAEEVAADPKVSSSLHPVEVVDIKPPVEASPAREVTASVSEKPSSAWVGYDVDEVPEIGEDVDSDCSVLVNVSSPGMHLVASPLPATSIHPTTTRSTGADFKWQRRDELSLKVKEQESESFVFQGGDDEYEGCDEFDGAEDYDGEVIDCEEICQAISRMGVAEGGLPEHKGRHIRFNYNSDDEIDVEEVEVMRLRGVPTPRGKHLRFAEDEEVPTP